METQRTQIYDVPLPRDPSRVTAVHDGKKWISSIEPGSLEFDVLHGNLHSAVEPSGQDAYYNRLGSGDRVSGARVMPYGQSRR